MEWRPTEASALRHTFLIFGDYCRPSLRLAALMKLPVIFIGTDDRLGWVRTGRHTSRSSIATASDTQHDRDPPGRCRGNGRGVAMAIEKQDGPTVLALTRQLAVLDRTKLARRRLDAAATCCSIAGTPEAIVIATGSECPALSAVGASRARKRCDWFRYPPGSCSSARQPFVTSCR